MSIDDEEIPCDVIFMGSDGDDEGEGEADGDDSSTTGGRKILIKVKTTFTYIPPSQEEDEDDVSMALADDDWIVRSIRRKHLFDHHDWSRSSVCRVLESVRVPEQDVLVTRILHEVGVKMSDDFYKNSKVMRFHVMLDVSKQMEDGDCIDFDDYDDDDDDGDMDDGDDDEGDDNDDDDDDMDDNDDVSDFPVFNLIPANRSSVERLTSVRVEEGCPQNCCTICLDEISVGSVATLMPCSHLYHCSCIRHWLQQRNFCPLCRREVA